MSSRDFIYKNFAKYYADQSTNIPLPADFTHREFAFLLLKEQMMVRHKSFAGLAPLSNYIIKNVPSDIYHSCAYYDFPEADMEKKVWRGADLVFDIDADHIPTNCNKLHDEWICGKCGFFGKGVIPEVCPACGGLKFDAKTWPCEKCLDSAKNETIKLVNILSEDLGFSDEDTHVYFSGHRGYHVHIEKEIIRELDAMARREIVDYILGIGITLLNSEVVDQKKNKYKKSKIRGIKDFNLNGFGWNNRLKNGIFKFISDASMEDFKKIGLKANTAVTLIESKNTVLESCIHQDNWKSVDGVSIKTWQKIAEYVKDLESSKIDTVVTTDIHRLIRANGTLHGKTGMLKKEFSVSNLSNYDPFKDAVAFKSGEAEILVSNAPKFRIGDATFGPFRNQKVTLPTSAAVLLVCKKRAEVIE